MTTYWTYLNKFNSKLDTDTVYQLQSKHNENQTLDGKKIRLSKTKEPIKLKDLLRVT